MAMASGNGSRPDLTAIEVVPTPRGTLDRTIEQYLDTNEEARPAAIAIAAAGRVDRSNESATVHLTNVALTVDQELLRSRFGVAKVVLVNDMAASAAALPCLVGEELELISGRPDAAPAGRLVVGVGTGFGASCLGLEGSLVETEAGHADLPTVDISERVWLDAASPSGRCSVEHILSGPGLLRLYAAISGRQVEAHESFWAAHAQGDEDALATVSVFSKWLGRAVANLVLGHGAWGGVALTGGVIERTGSAFDIAGFQRGFEDKPSFSTDLAKVPIWLLRHPRPALLGLARLTNVVPKAARA